MTGSRILIENAQLYTPTGTWEPGWLLTNDRTIRLIGRGNLPEFEPSQVVRRIDACGGSLLPGFIDLHVHGAVGYEVMDADPERLTGDVPLLCQPRCHRLPATT
jgi:N-acetylglucosamine-6-phosphate deacetylase